MSMISTRILSPCRLASPRLVQLDLFERIVEHRFAGFLGDFTFKPNQNLQWLHLITLGPLKDVKK